MALARKHTSFTKEEINGLFSRAIRRIKHSAFDILLAPSNNNHGRLLVVLSKKVGIASDRVKIKRKIKTIFRLYFASLPFDCIVIVKRYSLSLSSIDIKQLFLKAYENQTCI